MIFVQLIALALLFVLSAFFSASETALTALSALRVKRLSVLRPQLNAYLGEWLSKPHRLLTTILIGNNIVNIAISSLAAIIVVPAVVRVDQKAVEIIVWLVTTGALFILAEMIPKIIARTYRERVTLFILPLLGRLTRFVSLFLAPVHWLLERWSPRLDALPVDRLTDLSLDEIYHMMNEFQSTGHMPSESGKIMERLLALPQRSVQEILIPARQVDSVAMEVLMKGANAIELFVDLLIETGRTRVLITAQGNPVGYINIMDLQDTRRLGEVKSIKSLIRTARDVSPRKEVFKLLLEFQKSGEHMVFVRKNNGDFLGLVTLEDVLEEIVGEILDEYDVERARHKQEPKEGKEK